MPFALEKIHSVERLPLWWRPRRWWRKRLISRFIVSFLWHIKRLDSIDFQPFHFAPHLPFYSLILFLMLFYNGVAIWQMSTNNGLVSFFISDAMLWCCCCNCRPPFDGSSLIIWWSNTITKTTTFCFGTCYKDLENEGGAFSSLRIDIEESHIVWKSCKKSHSKLRANRATFIF